MPMTRAELDKSQINLVPSGYKKNIGFVDAKMGFSASYHKADDIVKPQTNWNETLIDPKIESVNKLINHFGTIYLDKILTAYGFYYVYPRDVRDHYKYYESGILRSGRETRLVTVENGRLEEYQEYKEWTVKLGQLTDVKIKSIGIYDKRQYFCLFTSTFEDVNGMVAEQFRVYDVFSTPIAKQYQQWKLCESCKKYYQPTGTRQQYCSKICRPSEIEKFREQMFGGYIKTVNGKVEAKGMLNVMKVMNGGR